MPQFPIFHAGYVLDEALIVSSHSSATAYTYTIDFAKALYRLSPEQESDASLFLKEEMLDFGENSRPFFVGNQYTGELYIAANTKVGDEIQGRIWAYELRDNQARLISSNYLNIGELNLTEPSYQRYTTKDNQTYHIVTGDYYENNVPEKKFICPPSLTPRTELN